MHPDNLKTAGDNRKKKKVDVKDSIKQNLAERKPRESPAAVEIEDSTRQMAAGNSKKAT